MLNSSILSIDGMLSDTMTPGPSEPESDNNEDSRLQHYWSPSIRLFSVISRTLVELGVGSYPSEEMQSECINQASTDTKFDYGINNFVVSIYKTAHIFRGMKQMNTSLT